MTGTPCRRKPPRWSRTCCADETVLHSGNENVGGRPPVWRFPTRLESPSLPQPIPSFESRWRNVLPQKGVGASMSSKQLTCRDCGAAFVFTAREQEFYAERGFTNQPSRCPDCRAARKTERGSGGVSSGARTDLYPAICSECGRQTEVPFAPSPGRPIYCAECFRSRRPDRDQGEMQGRDQGGRRDNRRRR